MEQGGRLAAKAKVTDEILDKCKPIAGTPADCIAAIEEYRDAGCTHVMLELWGDRPARADRAVRREGAARMSVEIDADRLVAAGRRPASSIPSPTGDEQAMGERVRDELADMGLQVQWQEVEDGRPNVVGTLATARAAASR